MRIVSTFNDYYDSVQNLGHDKSLTFVRKLHSYKYTDKKLPQVIADFYTNSYTYQKVNKEYYDSWLFYRSFIVKKIVDNRLLTITYNFHKFIVFFCGKMYPGVKCYYNNGEYGRPINTTCFYNYESLFQFIQTNEIEINTYRKYEIEVDKMLKSLFEGYKENTEWLIANKITIAVIDNKPEEIIINPSLKFYDFYKVQDAYTAFQNIEMYMGGVLPSPPNFMIEVEDKYKITGHGFDPKYGFRKRPNKK